MSVSGSIGRRAPHAAAVTHPACPGIAGDLPALVAGTLRNGDELPEQRAAAGVERQHDPARNVALAERGAHDENAVVVLRGHVVAVPPRRRLVELRVALPQHLREHVRHPVLTEPVHELAGAGVERHHPRIGGGVDRPVGVGRAARAGGPRVAPHGPSRRGVERDHGVRRRQVHHAVRDDRRRPPAAAVVQPADGQRAHVRRVDLVQRGVAGVGDVEVVTRPVDGGHRVHGRERDKAARPVEPCAPGRILEQLFRRQRGLLPADRGQRDTEDGRDSNDLPEPGPHRFLRAGCKGQWTVTIIQLPRILPHAGPVQGR